MPKPHIMSEPDFSPVYLIDEMPDATKNAAFGDERTMTFMASMPGFQTSLEQARVLPISPVILNERLNILGEAADFVRDFEKALFGFSSGQDDIFLKKARYALDAAELVSEKVVKATKFMIEQRIIIGLVKASVRGNGLPKNFDLWREFLPSGIFETAKRNFNKKDLGLKAVVPYVPQLVEFLKEDDAIEAEKLILKYEWKAISDMAFLSDFNMEAVLLYVTRWHILRQWLSRRPEESLEIITNEINKIYEQTEIKL